ncbi:MAG: hypothetical protein ACUVTD_07685 [Nitrososphaerales archaeon]
MAKSGGWKIDPKNPYVYLLQYHLPVEEYKDFQSKYGEEFLKMKRDL